ncbi:F-box domain, cyclin-like protein [Tanacetum coccineum]
MLSRNKNSLNRLSVAYKTSKLRESLVVYGSVYVDGAECCGVWVMEHDSSFRKLFTIGARVSEILGFSKSGETIFEIRKEGVSLATLDVYDPCSHEIKNLEISGVDSSFFMGSYKESLLLLDHLDSRDLTIKDVSKVHTSLVEVKLVSCKSITSKGVRDLLTSCTSLEVLDLFGCTRVTDFCISSISHLQYLFPSRCTTRDVLNLREHRNIGTMERLYLGEGTAPILHVSSFKRLQAIRNCLLVTNKAMKALAKRGRLQHEFRLLRNLDICNRQGIYLKSVKYLKKPYFHALQWTGIGQTSLILIANTVLPQICRERPWLTICKDGCEVGCRDGCYIFISVLVLVSLASNEMCYASRNLLQATSTPQPQIPAIPNLPQIPSIPNMPQPQMPTIPNMPQPQMPTIPTLPNMPKVSLPPLPSMPTIPNLPTTIPQIPFFAPPPLKK